jgi:ABC-type nitrate/sulfonate/bicarbonate transport system permease component
VPVALLTWSLQRPLVLLLLWQRMERLSWTAAPCALTPVQAAAAAAPQVATGAGPQTAQPSLSRALTSQVGRGPLGALHSL